VTFVREQQELDVTAVLLQRVDDLLRFDERHVGVVRAVHDEHRGAHAFQLVNR